MTHDEPASPGVNTDPEIVQSPEILANEYAPSPEPPEAVKVNGSPYVACVDVTDTTA